MKKEGKIFYVSTNEAILEDLENSGGCVLYGVKPNLTQLEQDIVM